MLVLILIQFQINGSISRGSYAHTLLIKRRFCVHSLSAFNARDNDDIHLYPDVTNYL